MGVIFVLDLGRFPAVAAVLEQQAARVVAGGRRRFAAAAAVERGVDLHLVAVEGDLLWSCLYAVVALELEH